MPYCIIIMILVTVKKNKRRGKRKRDVDLIGANGEEFLIPSLARAIKF